MNDVKHILLLGQRQVSIRQKVPRGNPLVLLISSVTVNAVITVTRKGRRQGPIDF